ncbi:MAG: 23S rRNA (uracil(1939)-C(5))-methyltransferase RlmD [Cellulosilyticaceae bacterium]
MLIEKNKCYQLEIIDIGSNGEGIGKIDAFVIFVPDAIIGDIANVKILKVKKNLAYGKVQEIIKASPNRVQPMCDVSKQCGGCQLQHMDYQAQLDWKQKKVYNAITRIGGIQNIEVEPTIGMEHPTHYRNKAQYPIRKVDGKVQIGFYAMRSHRVIDWDTCEIQDKRCEAIIKKTREFLEDYNISIYDEEKHTGLVRHLMIKTGYYTKEIMVCLVINGDKLPQSDKFIESMNEIEGMTSIVLNHNTAKTNVILGNKITVLDGKNYIIDTIGELKFKISPLAFYQVNPIQTKVLYDQVLKFADLDKDKVVWDAYCGIGTISLFLAQKAKHVYGVEIIEPAIENANENAEINNIQNATFFVGKAEEVITQQYKQGLCTDVVVVDPPRKGCDEELLQTIVEMSPKKIIYVSCDPATLGRDLGILTKQGYEVENIQPVDLFPHTTHVECCVSLKKIK